VNYPTLLDLTASLRVGLSAYTTAKLRVRESRGRQRGEKHRTAVSPSQPDWERQRRTLGRALEQRVGEAERKLFSCRQQVGQNGSPRRISRL
jgi:hypothetical protein